MVVGRLMLPRNSLRAGCAAARAAQQVKLVNPVKAGQALRWADVAYDAGARLVRVRREMESIFVVPKQRRRKGEALCRKCNELRFLAISRQI